MSAIEVFAACADKSCAAKFIKKFFAALIIPIRAIDESKKILTICSSYRSSAVVELP
jgi:hypothetical protein